MWYELHFRLADTAMYFALALTIWGFIRYVRGMGVDGSYLGAVVICQVLLVVQALLGVMTYATGFTLTGMHLLYGIVALITLPAFYAFTRGQDSRREMLLWALISLFLFGIIIRVGQETPSTDSVPADRSSVPALHL